ncbi:hypothetical protein [Psittacicella hinzii]|uniref:Uncharacterized protein n=1 Tax=Psittacicella hinzii TaxID=2028575 RepID=A0A3A1YI22_9GAMM|nr:hypothetical protein [Psittacicella hinzii]RIY37903.1 hypothetical protein CKF58_04475 [Psittacicella hinzii]
MTKLANKALRKLLLAATAGLSLCSFAWANTAPAQQPANHTSQSQTHERRAESTLVKSVNVVAQNQSFTAKLYQKDDNRIVIISNSTKGKKSVYTASNGMKVYAPQQATVEQINASLAKLGIDARVSGKGTTSNKQHSAKRSHQAPNSQQAPQQGN